MAMEEYQISNLKSALTYAESAFNMLQNHEVLKTHIFAQRLAQAIDEGRVLRNALETDDAVRRTVQAVNHQLAAPAPEKDYEIIDHEDDGLVELKDDHWDGLVDQT